MKFCDFQVLCIISTASRQFLTKSIDCNGMLKCKHKQKDSHFLSAAGLPGLASWQRGLQRSADGPHSRQRGLQRNPVALEGGGDRSIAGERFSPDIFLDGNPKI